MRVYEHNPHGGFKRKHQPFSLDNFDDGYVDGGGRFRVYLPNHPRASYMGYVLRSIVAYEAYHNVEVPKKMAVHHKDGDRLNDSRKNLEMMLFGKHTALHNKRQGAWVERTCKNCGEAFIIRRWRLKDSSRGTFCSQNCYHGYPRTEKHKEHISNGLRKAYREGRRQ